MWNTVDALVRALALDDPQARRLAIAAPPVPVLASSGQPGPFLVSICQQVDNLAIRAVACGIAFDMPDPVR